MLITVWISMILTRKQKSGSTRPSFKVPPGLKETGVLTGPETWCDAFVANAPQLEQEIRLVYEGLRECILPADYTEDLIRWFREKGYRIYFLSNYSEGLYEKTKDRLHFIESFHGGVFSWKEKCLKPDARIYRILLKRYDLNPASCLFFDDREDNIVAACREGIHGVVFGPSVVEEILHNR